MVGVEKMLNRDKDNEYTEMSQYMNPYGDGNTGHIITNILKDGLYGK